MTVENPVLLTKWSLALYSQRGRVKLMANISIQKQTYDSDKTLIPHLLIKIIIMLIRINSLWLFYLSLTFLITYFCILLIRSYKKNAGSKSCSLAEASTGALERCKTSECIYHKGVKQYRKGSIWPKGPDAVMRSYMSM